ncbi:arylsulfatase [Pararhodobacter marinus]|uniref:arylsulfatase n=1 Tax=Pararhodobacter marinus TaxID=2184063 RepID=UPI0035185746
MSNTSIPGFPDAPRAPEGAPNILLVLTDDVGFGATSPFGGPVPMPHFARVAEAGVRLNRFHTTAMCSPTRASILTGRNHHRVGFGGISEVAYGAPGYNSVIPRSAATLGQVLSMNGYDTAWIGKNHNTPVWETTSMGPFDRWPNGYGFDYFYGFVGGAVNNFAPALIENRNFVEPPEQEDYILDRDLIDHGIDWLNRQHALNPHKPFLLYVAPGTAHSPHQAPPDWLEKFRGAFDGGWDAMREEIFERQKAMGVIPASAELTPRPAQIPSWKSRSDKEKALYCRMMEAHAAMLAHWDHQFGRLLDRLAESGQLDNTLIVYIQGDNGASGEGGLLGTMNDMSQFNVDRATLADEVGRIDDMYARIDDIGGPSSFGNYPVGWAWAMNTPFQWVKQVASHFGGTRNGLAVSWPRGLKARGEIRDRLHHVIDIAPTIYDLVGIEPPETYEGVPQMSFDGVSMATTLRDREAPQAHRTQYFELAGHRAMVMDGWMGSTTPKSLPWEASSDIPPEEWDWELYELDSDFSQARNLAEAEPERLAAIRTAFDAACEANNVHPIHVGYFYGLLQPKPNPLRGRTDFTYYPSGRRMPGTEFPDTKNRSWRMDAVCQLKGDDSGIIITQGGWVGGWSFYMKDGFLKGTYRVSDDAGYETRIASARTVPAGLHTLSMVFDFAGETLGGAADLSLEVDGETVAEGHIPVSIGKLMPGSEGVSIGFERGTSVAHETQRPAIFTGRIQRLDLSLGDGISAADAAKAAARGA